MSYDGVFREGRGLNMGLETETIREKLSGNNVTALLPECYTEIE